MPHDVFISHSSLDREVVDVIVAALEAAGIVCWIAPRDMIAAVPYTESIVRAIRECRALILVHTPNVAGSPHVLREVHQAAEGRVPILEFRAPGVDPALDPDLDYFLSPNHRLEWDLPVEAHLPKFVEEARKLVVASGGRPATSRTRPRAPRFSLALRAPWISCSVVMLMAMITPIIFFIIYINKGDVTLSGDASSGGLTKYDLGMRALEKGDADRAIDVFTETIKLENLESEFAWAPYAARVYAARGRAWLLKGRMSEAIDDFEKALSLDPSVNVRDELDEARAKNKLPEDVFAPAPTQTGGATPK